MYYVLQSFIREVKLLIEDIRKCLMLGHKNFIITGATGWIGYNALTMLYKLLGDDFFDRVKIFSNSSEHILLPDGKRIKCFKMSDVAALSKKHTYVLLHFAFLTKDKINILGRNTYLSISRGIQLFVRQLFQHYSIYATIYTSSGAVYTSNEESNLYGHLKLEDEHYFEELLAKKRMQKLVIARVFNIGGPHFKDSQTYALTSFVFNALRCKEIKVESKKLVYRSYIHVEDLIELLFISCFLESDEYVMFDTKGTEVLELYELAQKISSHFGNVAIRTHPDRGGEDRYYYTNNLQDNICNNFSYNLSVSSKLIADTVFYLQSRLCL